jgi:CheY-like chemotaxis protein
MPGALDTRPEPQGSVLCVEDHAVDFFLVQEALARWPKVAVQRAATVQAALAALARQRPSLLLLDLRLGEGSGLDVLQPIRRNPALADLKVFVLSADAMPSQMRAALDAGADGYWTKPLRIDKFMVRIQDLLSGDGTTSADPAAPSARAG